MSPTKAPEPFGRYELLEKLSVGGSAEVWFARPRGNADPSSCRVLKLAYPNVTEDRDGQENFQREALVAGSFQHPGIVRILEFGEVGGVHYIAREFVSGASLDMVMRRVAKGGTQLSPQLCVLLALAVADSLHHVHSRTDSRQRPLGIIHGHLESRHVLIGLHGLPKLIGFGGGHLPRPELVRVQHIRALRLPPEQIRGQERDRRSDIYGLGLLLYELLTGTSPFRRDSELETLHAVLQGEFEAPSRVAKVPAALDPVVMKAMARQPSERYSDMLEFRAALVAILAAQDWSEDLGALTVVGALAAESQAAQAK